MIVEAVLIGSKDRELWPWLAEQVQAQDIRLVIFDTLARMSLGLEENSASDMGNAVARFDRLRRDGETGVMVVHHTARGATTAVAPPRSSARWTPGPGPAARG